VQPRAGVDVDAAGAPFIASITSGFEITPTAAGARDGAEIDAAFGGQALCGGRLPWPLPPARPPLVRLVPSGQVPPPVLRVPRRLGRLRRRRPGRRRPAT
jgi:hypothetical protein